MKEHTTDTGESPSRANVKAGTAPSAAASRRAFCGDIDIRIDRDGVWYYHGSPIGRKELVRLFSTVLGRDEDGNYWLTTPAERGRIQVEDAPFMAVELMAEGSGRERTLRLRTNVDDVVTVDGDHPLRVVVDPETGEPSPYVTVRPGLDARIARPVYYELVALGETERVDGADTYGVWSSGLFFPLGDLEGAP